MVTFLTVLHIVVCVFLVTIVLLQHGKGADMGATFGGAGQTVFGARGAATLLSKITAGAAITFMVTSVSLAWYSAQESSKSVFSQKKEEAPGSDKASTTTTPTPSTIETPSASPSKGTPDASQENTKEKK